MSKVGPMNRQTAWLTRSGWECAYRYGGTEIHAAQFPPWMSELMKEVMPKCGYDNPATWPNSCNLNLYEDGGSSCGWLADDEAVFGPRGTAKTIISLSLGGPRMMEFRQMPSPSGKSTNNSASVRLRAGDVCIMAGKTQDVAEHRTPKELKERSVRINLTWRWIVSPTALRTAKGAIILGTS
ncbi:unnamed protein product, partial [Polarella glacialis]